jgi:hypothetical protein
MAQPIGRELSTLQCFTTKELRTRYTEIFGKVTNANNRTWLVKRIACRRTGGASDARSVH